MGQYSEFSPGTKKASHKISILQGEQKVCYITGMCGVPLHKHHIYFGTALRKISDKHGFWVWLTPEMHNMSEMGVHGKFGHELDLRLKMTCQMAFEARYSRAEFMRLIGRNYLED